MGVSPGAIAFGSVTRPRYRRPGMTVTFPKLSRITRAYRAIHQEKTMAWAFQRAAPRGLIYLRNARRMTRRRVPARPTS
jgi:hypothetical protein